jgi:excisionase family DNA binding protein
MEKFMTIKEVGAYLRLSAQSVKRMIEDGRLGAHKIGRCSYRIPEGAVRALLTQTLAGAFVDAFEAALEERKEQVQ